MTDKLVYDGPKAQVCVFVCVGGGGRHTHGHICLLPKYKDGTFISQHHTIEMLCLCCCEQ